MLDIDQYRLQHPHNTLHTTLLDRGVPRIVLVQAEGKTGGGGADGEVLDSEQYTLLQELKGVKVAYREGFERLKDLRWAPNQTLKPKLSTLKPKACQEI